MTNGGAAQVAITSARALAVRGWSVVFVHATECCDDSLAAADVVTVRASGADVWSLRNPVVAARRAIWNSGAYDAVSEVIAARRPGRVIVHAHQWTKALSPAALAAVSRAGADLVLTLHDYFACCPNGLLFRFDTVARCDLVPMSRRCVTSPCDRDGHGHKAVRLARQVVIRRVAGRAVTTFVHVSGPARDRALPYLPAQARHRVVPNPSPIERRPPVAVAGNHAFAFIGRLTREKGCRELAEAARGAPLKLLVIGDGPLRDVFAGLGEQVELLPWGGRDEVLAVLERSRGLVFPSLWDETAGLVAYEALARGVPVIASATTGAAEMVGRTGGGVLVPAGDVARLRAAMLSLAEATPAEATRLGAAAYDGYWADPLTVERHVETLEALYDEIASAPSGRRAP